MLPYVRYYGKCGEYNPPPHSSTLLLSLLPHRENSQDIKMKGEHVWLLNYRLNCNTYILGPEGFPKLASLDIC